MTWAIGALTTVGESLQPRWGERLNERCCTASCAMLRGDAAAPR
ncbi:hypothetical protein [Lentzea waywayandensis]|nr:hypothetical protein [Lentzea waywayandensis]